MEPSFPFQYARVEFIHDLKDADSDSIPLGFFAEWHDGNFWRISMCARACLTTVEFEPLDAMSKELLADPFGLLYRTADRYIKSKGWYQRNFTLDDFLTKCFPPYLSVQAPNLFQQILSPEESAQAIFDELADNVAKPSRLAIWHRLDLPQLVPSVDENSQD